MTNPVFPLGESRIRRINTIKLNCALESLQQVIPSTQWRFEYTESSSSQDAVPSLSELEASALKNQRLYKSLKPDSVHSKWARACAQAAKIGKGLLKDEKAQTLALRHWLEAIDQRHRYGHNLHLYYKVWLNSESSQQFFQWLDVGDGKDIVLEKCSRSVLQRQCIEYFGPKERLTYEVVIESGKLLYKESGIPVNTTNGAKWIFVLSTTKKLYVGQKTKGRFHHSSFLAGAATLASGRLVVRNGSLEALWPYSGHYCPTKENFRDFLNLLEENRVDLTNVKKCAVDDDSDQTAEENSAIKKSNVSTSPKLRLRRSATCSTVAGPLVRTNELHLRALERLCSSPKPTCGIHYDCCRLVSPRSWSRLRDLRRYHNSPMSATVI